MSKNDEIVLAANFQSWKGRQGDLKGVAPWLYFVAEQIVKPYALLDDEELRSGLTDGSGDGGSDAIYILANPRRLITEDSDLDPKSVSSLQLVIIQAKESGGFKHTEIDKWCMLTNDLLDLSKPADSFGDRYNTDVVRTMRVWKKEYLRITSESMPQVSIDYFYVTGSDAAPDSIAKDAGQRVKATVAAHLQATCTVHHIGATQLWELVQRRPPKAKTLLWAGQPMDTAEGWVGLVKLRDFGDLLTEDGALAERIFESNVRGFQDETGVNNGIRETLESDDHSANFWMLNNGVTIISPKAAQAGHLRLTIEDPQIVNGLQTSRLIYAYCTGAKAAKAKDDKRAVLVRVVQAAEADLQDKIIQATNSQNKMPAASLRMTDQVHRNIEEYFKKVDLFYDRRKGYYKDQGKPVRKIISVNAVSQAVISVLLQRPDDARARPGDYFKDDEKYKSVFGEQSVGAYLSCVHLVRRVDRFLENQTIESSDQKNLRFYVAALLARELTSMAKPVAPKLPAFDQIEKIEDKVVSASFARVRKVYDDLSLKLDRDKDNIARGPDLLKKLNAQWNRRHPKKQTPKPSTTS